MLRAVVLNENTSTTANEDEIKLYARSIGIDPHKEPDLLPIAKEGISAALPKGWQILQDENNQIFYYNSVSGQSLWEHPLDELYRKRVEETRTSKQNKTVPVKMTPMAAKLSSSSSSSSSTATKDHLPSDRHELPEKNNDASADVRPATPRFDSVQQKNSTQLDEKPVHSEWLNAPLLGDKIATPQRTEHTVPTCSNSESEAPTDYCELVPSHQSSRQSVSAHRRHTLLSVGDPAKNTTTTQAASCQTDNNSDILAREATQDWTLQHCASLNEADRRLSWLQTKLRQSLLSDHNTFFASPLRLKQLNHSMLPRRSTSFLNSPQHKLSTNTPVANLNKSSVEGIDNDLLHSSARFSRDRPSTQGLCPVLASPPCRETHTEPQLPKCPEVGVSPSDSTVQKVGLKSPQQSSGNSMTSFRLKTSGRSEEAQCSRGATGVLLERGQLERHRLTESAPVPFVAGGIQGINVGMSHLAEERARLQRKILRLKVIYKSYKQRLASLDSTILLLQQSSSTGGNSTVPNTSTFVDICSNGPEPENTVHRASPLSGTYPPHKASLRIHKTCSVSSESSTSTCRADSPSPEIIDIQEQSEPVRSVRKSRRSVSAPRQQPMATVYRHSAALSTRSHGIHRSVSQELAASLASIDAQLHHVLCHLEPSSAADNADADESAKQDNPENTSIQCARHNGYSGSPFTPLLQRGLANLSLSDHYGGTSGLGDLRLLTPVSPDCARHERLQKPQVDVSPTWLQSD